MIRRCNYIIPFIFLLLVSNVGVAQNDSLFRFLNKIEYPISSFTVNNLGELFIINTNNQLKKYNEKGDSIGVFNLVTKYGKLTYVEAQNPWKTILFYEQYATILLLDKYLNVLTNINLRNQNIFKVKAVTISYDNNIWLFDEQENKLKKIDDSGKELFASNDFRNIFDTVPTPVKITDADGYVYLYDPQLGLYKFDYYGRFIARLPFLQWKTFAVLGKSIYGIDEENLYRFTPPIPIPEEVKLIEALKNNLSIKILNSRIYSLRDNILHIYSF
ncbi:hypothetical protein BH20BAC1_BH20BAC1_19920 [soil metagenome]